MNIFQHRRQISSIAFLLAVLLVAAGARAQLPIPAGPNAPTRHRYRQKLVAEASQLDKQYDQHTKDPPKLREKAHKLLIAGQHGDRKPAVKLSRAAAHKLGLELMASGSKDPLIVAVTMVTRPNVDDGDAVKAHCEQAIKDVVESNPWTLSASPPTRTMRGTTKSMAYCPANNIDVGAITITIIVPNIFGLGRLITD